jgi:hypothetical protein
MSFFWAIFFLNPNLHTTFSPRIQYKRRGEERKKNRKKGPGQVVGGWKPSQINSH